VGSGRRLTSAGGRTWTFATPRGVHTVLSKEIGPVWVRPDWAYVEVARSHGLRVEYLDASRPRAVRGGGHLVIRDGFVGILADTAFSPLPVDEEIVFDRVLFVPPINSENRRMAGELGRYRLNLGDGIGIHGTPHTESIGRSVTHGCLRLGDDDIEWLYVNVPVGTRVYIY
jgi:lipoprotein-anchoring transpeptidase ErfK/SrfK